MSEGMLYDENDENEESVLIDFDSHYYAIDMANAIKATFSALLESFKEHNDVSELEMKDIDVVIREPASGISHTVKLQVNKDLSHKELQQYLQELVNLIEVIAPSLHT